MPEALLAPTIKDSLADAAARLAAAGCETPRLDAELLLAASLGVDRAQLVLDRSSVLEGERATRFEALVARRAAREPVAYILGGKHFRYISLAVDRRALIPRPETELLVEVGLTLCTGARVVDVGTGSGAVALALKDERRDLEVWATEVSGDALALARENAGTLALEVQLVHTDLIEGIPPRFDAVLANLPYVADGAALSPEIALYEPAGALFAGPDGLDTVRRLMPMTGSAAVVALEVGQGQAATVAGLMQDAGFRSIELLRDLAGHERVVVGRR